MRRILFVAAAFALTGTAAVADDSKPAQPTQVAPVRIAQLEEEFETLEAQRDVKKAYVKAAMVAMEATQADLDRVKELFAKGTLGKPELDRAKFDMEAAKAQLDIRLAEMKEIEVKLKYAKKRLEDAKKNDK